MTDFTIKVPDEFQDAVHLSKEELQDHIRLMAALKMFELGKLSSGKAAEFAGLSRLKFFEACERYKISVYNYADDEISEALSSDMKNLENRDLP